MCSTTQLKDQALTVILRLEDTIAHQPSPPDPFVSSALVCVSDAWDLFDEGAFLLATRRADRGLSYLIPFHNRDWKVA